MKEKIKPYYRKGNKYFYRKGKQRMNIEVPEKGNYVFNGDVIEGEILLPLHSAQKTTDKIWATVTKV